MEPILEGVLEVAGVGAALVLDGAGALVAHRGRSVYDRTFCEQLCGTLARVTDALQLQQDDWDAATAQYADGRLLLRNLGAVDGQGYVLAVVADAALNPSAATVAIRVAANKLRKALGRAPSSTSQLSPAPSAPPAARSAPPPPASDASALANSGVAWSRSPSSVTLSRVHAADPASAAFLARCAKELARHVGPMAKVYVEEAVRRVAGDQPFAMPHAPRLLDDVSGQVEDPEDRAQFRRVIQRAQSQEGR